MARSPQLQRLLSKLRAYPIAILGGSLALVFGGAIFFRSSTLSALEFELAENEREWSRINGNMKRSRDLDAHLARIQELEAEVDARLMDAEQLAINYEYFYSLEKEARVELVNLNQSGVINSRDARIPGIAPFESYSLVGYNLSLNGEFEEVLGFIYRLQNGHHLTRISSFTVSRAAQSGARALTANVQVQILGTRNES